ncbi:MAG: endonuclease/exonuclease/phosphatase family protein [Bacteroidales bacterium]|nr:endonuclease/exonuclease/phosphatase family protein [Bacteroidales bacterium]
MFNKILKTKTIFILFSALIFTSEIQAQKKQYKVACVGFYNLENLFDTIDSPDTYDYEFLPSGKKVWTGERYYKKLNKMADVISQIGDEVIKGGPHILGVSEIENRSVLEDLIKMPQLKSSNYGIIHYDSPDERGIDVGLIYRKDYFKILHTSSHVLKFSFDSTDETRAQLVVTGIYDGDTLNFIVNHWPSRGGGQKISEPKRNAAGDLSRLLVDSILFLDTDAKIIVMGDLNDNPDNESVKKHLFSNRHINKLKPGELFNPYYNVYKRGVGTTAYRDAWSLFDQLIISQGLISEDRSSFVYWKTNIFRKKFIISTEGRYKGYPKRTFSFDLFQNGYSDHFPVYLFLIKEK